MPLILPERMKRIFIDRFNNRDDIRRKKNFRKRTGSFLIISGPYHIFCTSMNEKEPLSFEEALKKLEAVVNKLEDDTVSLEESVALFEEGTRLSAWCSEVLGKAELRIEKVNAQNEG